MIMNEEIQQKMNENSKCTTEAILLKRAGISETNYVVLYPNNSAA